MGRGVLTAIALLAALALPSAAAAQYPYGPEESPDGANDYSCVPTAEHPDPVVLVHGLSANAAQNWGYVAPALADEGYCVFALTYGRKTDNPQPFDQPGGFIPMEESAQQLSGFIDGVLESTGAEKVDIVGHSEGSLMPNYYVKFMEGWKKVDDYVGLTPLWDGTNVAGIADLRDASGSSAAVFEDFVANGCESCPQFVRGSDFLRAMSEGPTGPRVEGVTYTMIMTKYDELVVPYTSGIMDGATNIVIQDQCAADPSEHGAVAFNPLVLQDIRNALDPANAKPVDCTTYFA
jgi:triacylglycerol esterase/lipase EstA (alpha/beta hydrolase family)